MSHQTLGRVSGRALKTLITVLATVMGMPLSAQSWPIKPVRIVVPYAPGGVTDSVTRITAPKLQEALGQPVLIENKLGAGGALATDYVAKSAADGYTLLMGSAAPQTLLQYVQKTSYDGVKDFAPVTLINTNPLVLMVNPDLPVKSVRELIAMAKAQPGKLNFAGAGGLTQFSGEIFKFMAGIDIVYVPYKGGAPATAAAVAGDVQITFANYSDALAQMRAGRLRALALTTPRRFPQSPDVPTIAESGYPSVITPTWQAVFAPPKTSRDVALRLASEIAQALKQPETRSRLDAQAFIVDGMMPEALSSAITEDFKLWQSFVRDHEIPFE